MITKTNKNFYKIWKLVRHIPAYQHILYLRGYSQKSLNLMDNFEEERIEENKFLDKEYKEQWEENLIKYSDKELLEIFTEAKFYLQEQLEQYQKEKNVLIPEIEKMLKNIYQETKQDEFTVWFREEIVKIWLGKRLNWLSKKIDKLKWILNPPKKSSSGRITDEMISRAKEYPFENLIESKKKFALCPFHKEKNPSFYIKNNWGFCFSCDWHGDTIKFLMERDGISFKEAVTRLA